MKIQEPLIHVGILSAPTIQFSLEGIYIFDNKEFTGQKTVRIIDHRILFDEQMYDEVILTPTLDTCFFELTDVVIGINFHWERKENQRFNGDLKLIIEQEQLTAINRIAVEDYLTSVISSEMSATASDELLKAHAVISRSWLLHPILNAPVGTGRDLSFSTANKNVDNSRTGRDLSNSMTNKNGDDSKIIKWYERDAHTHFDVCADDHCQRYQGITRASTEAVQKAIDATRGQVLMYNDKICDARFSKSCGGASETFENCWAPVHHPYLTKVIDNAEMPEGFETDLTIEVNAEKWIRESPAAFCNTKDKKILSQVLNNYDQETTDFYRWRVMYSQDEISELLARRSGINFGQIIDLIPVSRGESGRLIELKIVGTKQTIIVGKELEIRKWLSNSHLYSSAFVVDKSEIVNGIPQHFTLTGAGWGHGVGLCQIGAAVMGEKGYRYDEILLHYFSGAELKKTY